MTVAGVVRALTERWCRNRDWRLETGELETDLQSLISNLQSLTHILLLLLLATLVACGDAVEEAGVDDVVARGVAVTPTLAASASVLEPPPATTVATNPTATLSHTPPASATSSATSTATATATASATATATTTATPTPTSTATSTPSAYPPLAQTPGEPQPYLEQFTMVSFYGSAEGAGMGILNFRETPQLLAELRRRASEYQALLPEKDVLPTFHVIVTIADPWFGEDRNFNHRASLESIEQWLALAEEEGIGVVLDVQPGHAPIQEEFERIRPYLYHPHVHLALDSEYTMERTPEGLYEIPGDVLGSLYAEQINPIQAQLEEIALEIGVKKVLILHQFEDEMLPDKENIENYEHVELVIDSDGFGGPDKVRDYHQYAGEPGFDFGGIKLYRNWDNPLLAPQNVLDLEPPAAVVIYQ
ncbi:MAG: hypothetical protein ACOC9Z_05830 [Chloroflexota bacterium]